MNNCLELQGYHEPESVIEAIMVCTNLIDYELWELEVFNYLNYPIIQDESEEPDPKRSFVMSKTYEDACHINQIVKLVHGLTRFMDINTFKVHLETIRKVLERTYYLDPKKNMIAQLKVLNRYALIAQRELRSEKLLSLRELEDLFSKFLIE